MNSAFLSYDARKGEAKQKQKKWLKRGKEKYRKGLKLISACDFCV